MPIYIAKSAVSVLMDGAVHHACGFQLAGLPHVIVSPREADDELSVAVARTFYRIRFHERDIVGYEKVAHACTALLQLYDEFVKTRCHWLPK